MGKKGQKSMRGQAELYRGEVKRQRSVMLTDSGLRGLDQLAADVGLSRSELVERIGRGLIQIQMPSI